MITRNIISRADARAAGLKRYFTGKPCVRGHLAERCTNRKYCLECKREKDSVRYYADPERHKAERKDFREANKERLKLRRIQRRVENYEHWQAVCKAYRNAHPAKIRARNSAWYEANKERAKASARAYVAANPDAVALWSRNRRARIKCCDGTHTQSDIVWLERKQRGKCVYCPSSIKKDRHVDHIMPLKRGGSNARSNLQLLCVTCNLKKNAKHPVVFAQEMGMLL